MLFDDFPIAGVIPAAGKGSRLLPYRFPKELFPLTLERNNLYGTWLPKTAIEYSLQLLSNANIARCMVVVGESKFEIVRYLGNGDYHNISISYLFQRVAAGMCQAIDLSFPWLNDHIVCLCMPDTIIYPATAVEETLLLLKNLKADVALGAFKTNTPERFGPVKLKDDGYTVEEVYDKPSYTDLKNTWGLACWKPSFSSFLHEYLKAHHSSDTEITLGSVLQSALEHGFSVVCKQFATEYVDIGTPQGLKNFLDHKA